MPGYSRYTEKEYEEISNQTLMNILCRSNGDIKSLTPSQRKYLYLFGYIERYSNKQRAYELTEKGLEALEKLRGNARTVNQCSEIVIK